MRSTQRAGKTGRRTRVEFGGQIPCSSFVTAISIVVNPVSIAIANDRFASHAFFRHNAYPPSCARLLERRIHITVKSLAVFAICNGLLEDHLHSLPVQLAK